MGFGLFFCSFFVVVVFLADFINDPKIEKVFDPTWVNHRINGVKAKY